MGVVDDFVRLVTDGAGKAIDASVVVVNALNVYRQRVNISSPTDPAGHAEVKTAPDGSEMGLVGRVFVHDIPQKTQRNLDAIARALALAPDPATGRLRVLADINGGTLTTVTALTTLTNYSSSNFLAASAAGTITDSQMTMIYALERNNWANSVRPRFV